MYERPLEDASYVMYNGLACQILEKHDDHMVISNVMEDITYKRIEYTPDITGVGFYAVINSPAYSGTMFFDNGKFFRGGPHRMDDKQVIAMGHNFPPDVVNHILFGTLRDGSKLIVTVTKEEKPNKLVSNTTIAEVHAVSQERNGGDYDHAYITKLKELEAENPDFLYVAVPFPSRNGNLVMIKPFKEPVYTQQHIDEILAVLKKHDEQWLDKFNRELATGKAIRDTGQFKELSNDINKLYSKYSLE